MLLQFSKITIIENKEDFMEQQKHGFSESTPRAGSECPLVKIAPTSMSHQKSLNRSTSKESF